VATTRLMPARSARLVLIPLESRGLRLLVLVLTLLAAVWAAAAVVRPAIAAHLAGRAATADALERALAWDAQDPDLHLRLGRAHASTAERPDHDKAQRHLETALRLRPTDAYARLYLAVLFDQRGDRGRAREALDSALRADPHDVAIRWEAALLAFRWGDRDRALEHFRYVLAVDPSQRDAAFQLARLLLRPGEDPGALLPPEPQGLTNVLLAAMRHETLDLAEVAWTQRASLRPAVPHEIGRRYLDLLLEEGEGRTARRVWAALVPDGYSGRDGNTVWNGGFETDRLLGWGLDWRVQRAWGVEVALDRFVAAAGSRSLRLTFNSFPTLNFAGVSQVVAVEPGRAYRLRAQARAVDFVTRSGLKLQVVQPRDEQVLAETNAIAGTTTWWVPLEARVQVPADTSLVLLRLRREPAPVPEGNLGGKAWVDEVSLE
jgi:tetratricopeptide (TPR) repeat protein